jgi:hypothetical protein
MAVDYEALAREFGGNIETDAAGGMTMDAEGRPVMRVNIGPPRSTQPTEESNIPRGVPGAAMEPVSTVNIPPSDYAALAAEFGGGISTPEPETSVEGVGGALARGLAPTAAFAALGGAMGGPPGALAGAAFPAVVDPIVMGINALFGTNFTEPTAAMENLLTSIGVPEAKTAAERVLQTTAGAVGGGAGMIGLGRGLMAQAPGAARTAVTGIGEILAARPGAQLAGAATGGAVSQLTAEAGGGPAAQLAAGLVGSVAGGAAVPRPRVPLPAIVQEAEAVGVPLMTSDVLPPRTFAGRTAQATGERIPLAGTGPVREAQQQARINAVRDIVTDYGAADGNALPEQIVADLAQRRSATIRQYSDNKNEVINRLAGSGNVPVQSTIDRIGTEIAALRRRKTSAGDEAADALEQIRTDIQGRNLFELESYRKDVLSSVFKNDPANQISAPAREAGAKALRAIYDPVRKDMGAFIRRNGERRDFDKWMVSNKRLSEEAGELQKQSLSRVLKTGEATPEAVESLLFSSKPSDVAALYRNLSPQGRAVARQAIIARAATKATSTGEDAVSPTRFANEIQTLAKQVGIFFSGDELARVQGLSRVLNATRRAGEAGAFPVTGAQTFIPTATVGGVGAFGGGFEGFLGAMATAGGIGAIARIYESAAMRNLLLKAGKTNNRERLVEIAKRMSAVAQSETQPPSEETE